MNTWQKLAWVILVFTGIILGSCREDFEFESTTGDLAFSKDTLFLDTVFSSISSSTYTVKVYNRSSSDISIPQITLRNGSTSNYRLNVDGVPGKYFEDIPMLAKDSLFIFVETTVSLEDSSTPEFLYTDAIRFGQPGDYQEVALVTLVKDAIFLYARESSETIVLNIPTSGSVLAGESVSQGFYLAEEELRFTKEKPYVIYGYATVPEGSTLTMEAGTRVFFHENSGIVVQPGGSLHINGSASEDEELLENEVIFEGDRLEPRFTDVPGQWGTIYLSAGSTGNQMEHLTIRNASIGLLVEGDHLLQAPTLTLKNSQIHNSLAVNLWARNAFMEAQNSIFGSSGGISLHLNLGGTYEFGHCTIANYWTSGFRTDPALRIDDHGFDGAGNIATGNLTRASFSNCIVDGNRAIELALSNRNDSPFEYVFLNCSIKFSDPQEAFADRPLYDFTNPDHYRNVFLNAPSAFANPMNGDFRPTTASEILDLGDMDQALRIPLDILGHSRTQSPDLGAYELP